MRLIDLKLADRPARLALAALTMLGLLAFLGMNPAGASAAGSLNIYKNTLKSADGRAELRQFNPKDNCARGGSKSAFRAKVGKSTRECFYRLPVVGRDLSITASARLFRSTPKKVRPQARVSVNLRQARDGSRYQLSVFPSGRRFQLMKVLPNGRIQNLAHGKVGNKVKGFNQANRITLRAYNVTSGANEGTAKLVASANGNRLAVVDDPRGNQLTGRDSTIGIGSKRNANGAFGSFNGLAMAMPDPF